MQRKAHAAEVRRSSSCAQPRRPPTGRSRKITAPELAAMLGCSTEEAAARAVRFMAAYLRDDKLT